ncbi:hypothetical protein [Clostridium intestinale]|uniref:Uncharacterized protein n=1 Tax=Clostridium intestinale DSM 6191 TaxID=1121320 RepID=A0A1M5YH99_9CLOT|nr:hypothetical protein [Clostridium intestinale]SHI11304.1 hypothetical protein SAMN02745941_01990 [Clostridium intestinale DSM 6191]
MKKKFSRLFIINILFYLNNFLYLIFGLKIESNSLQQAWSITPLIFIAIVYDFMDYLWKNNLSIKNKSIVDFIIRILAFLAVLYSDENKMIFFILLMILMTITNILIEFDIKKDINNNNYYKDIKEFDLYENEKLDNLIKRYYYYKNVDLDKCNLDNRYEVDKMFKLEKNETYSKWISFCLMYINLATSDLFKGKIKFFIGVVLLISFFVYIRTSQEKFSYFYKDDKILKIKNIRNNVFLFIGMSTLYIMKVFIIGNTLFELSFKSEMWILVIAVLLFSFSLNESQQILNKFTDKG